MREPLITMSDEKNPKTDTQKTIIPKKFQNPEAGALNVDALLKSYLALEKKLGEKKETQETTEVIDAERMDKESLLKAIGVPETIETYQQEIEQDMFEVSQDIFEAMREKGFTVDQAQFVFDLAKEKMMPMIIELVEDFEADRELEKLVDYFGGEKYFKEVSRQVLAFGKRNLKPEVLAGLSTSYEGVITLYTMMMKDEPSPIEGDTMSGAVEEKDLKKLINDPRYWRDRDPKFVKKVTQEFQRFYGQS